MNINPIVMEILKDRGIDDASMDEFLSTRPKLTYDPFLMKGMDEASDLIIEYAEAGKKICIYGDYDSDGINSVALMMTVLKELGADSFYHIPSRFTEGYGLNSNAIGQIHDKGAELLVTVDCGCTSIKEVAFARSLGMEVIVTDHHTLSEELPDCILLNPKQPGDTYPYAGLCGCGVAFKLAQAIYRKKGFDKSKINELLDITGIATVGDIVPLLDENRTLVKYGIDRIKKGGRAGLRGLIDEISLNSRTIDSGNVAFGIVPNLNACGRLASATTGVELLLATSDPEIRALSSQMVSYNNERKRMQEAAFKSAVDVIEEGMADDPFLVHYASDAHEGITGIVAGKLKDRYNRPVVILTDTPDHEILKGTGRSISGINLYDTLKPFDHLFTKFGGHAGACGFSMKRSGLEELRSGLNDLLRKRLEDQPDLLDFRLKLDASIDADEVSLELANQVKLMEPFGAENPRPVFEVRDITVKSIRSMGREGQYRKFACVSTHGRSFDIVAFDTQIEGLYEIGAGQVFDAAGELETNTWNGRTTVQITLRKIL